MVFNALLFWFCLFFLETMIFILHLAPLVHVLVSGTSAVSPREPSATLLLQPVLVPVLALAEGICVVWLGAAGAEGPPKSTGVAFPPPGSHPSPVPTRVAFRDNGSHACWLRQLPSARASPSAARRSIPTERGQACIMTLTSQDSLD